MYIFREALRLVVLVLFAVSECGFLDAPEAYMPCASETAILQKPIPRSLEMPTKMPR